MAFLHSKNGTKICKINKMAKKPILSCENVLPMWFFFGLGGYLVYKSGLRFSFRGPEVPFLVPPKLQITRTICAKGKVTLVVFVQPFSKRKHVLGQLEDFLNSEVKPKWLRCLMLTPPWPPNAWSSAKHWPARARPSTSPWPSALTSPSPWTPGVRQQAKIWRRRQVLPPLGEMLSGERIIFSRSDTLHQRTSLKKWKLH